MFFRAITIGLPLAVLFPDTSNLRHDERIIIFPTLGYQTDAGEWKWPFHAWVFEPEENSILRGKFIDSLRKSMSLSPADEESAIFRRRERQGAGLASVPRRA
jgi:hypothetical protein